MFGTLKQSEDSPWWRQPTAKDVFCILCEIFWNVLLSCFPNETQEFLFEIKPVRLFDRSVGASQ